ncbi:MAG: SDR family oxidoreductase [Gemmatimonadetes bacterium]|nr:SDR family oxidoreductase [Gemmatimonadota bacterium]
MHIDLTGKTVLVTGASRGIGRSLAEGLAGAGATVAVHFNQSHAAGGALAETLGHDARAFQADLAEPESCERLFDEVIGAYGRLDVLVNNAGIALKIPFGVATDEWRKAWDLTMAVNLRAVELLSRLAVQHFQQHDGGRIINVASRAAFRGDTPEYMSYAASKGGVVSLTRSIARAFGKAGVCAFVLAPGFVRTEMAQEAIDEYGEAHVTSDLALDRLTEPADLTPLVVLLASGLADHATGTTIDVNAGSYVR